MCVCVWARVRVWLYKPFSSCKTNFYSLNAYVSYAQCMHFNVQFLCSVWLGKCHKYVLRTRLCFEENINILFEGRHTGCVKTFIHRIVIGYVTMLSTISLASATFLANTIMLKTKPRQTAIFTSPCLNYTPPCILPYSQFFITLWMDVLFGTFTHGKRPTSRSLAGKSFNYSFFFV